MRPLPLKFDTVIVDVVVDNVDTGTQARGPPHLSVTARAGLHVAVGAGAAGGPALGHISLLLSIFVIIEDRFPSRQIIEHLRLRRVSKFKMAECLLVLEFLLRDTLASFLVLIQPPAQTAERLSTAELTTCRHAVLFGFDAFTA